MLNKPLLYKILGSLLMLETFFMTLSMAVAFIYREDDIVAFALSIFITMGAAITLRYAGRNATGGMSRKEAFLIVTLTWVVFSLFGCLPYLLGGYIPRFTNAYFETISGFTTTGASIIDDVEVLPHGILFWRSFTQWIGSLGIVFFTIAVLPQMVGGSIKVFAAEATGPIKAKLHPRLSSSAQSIWVIFLSLTIVCAVSYNLLGMNWFDSINYSMTTIATGGFAPHNDSILHFKSIPLEYVSTFFCFVSGINFILLYRSIVMRRIQNLFSNAELRFYVWCTVVFTFFIMAELVAYNDYDAEKAFRCGLFQVVSFLTTTGLFNDDAAQWPRVTWVVLAICMFMGGCAGSTSGGFKSIRSLMLIKNVRNEMKQMLHPKAVLPLKIDDNNISYQHRVTLLAFLSVYCIMALVCAVIMITAGIDHTNAITITISTLSNAGLSLSTDIGPAMTWDDLPDFAKWSCAVLMLMGRLEIFSVLVIFTPEFWKET